MKIGILQAGHAPDAMRPETGDYDTIFATLLAGHGFSFAAYDVENMVFPDSVHDCDGWLITGSRHGVYEDHPFIAPLEQFVRDAFAADVPLVGVCFGHQIIAQALGGKVEKFAGGWAVGRQIYDWQGDQIALNAWHQDQVVEAPAQATRLATNDFCGDAALVYGKNAFTVQAHPEYDHNFISGLATHRAPGVVPEPLRLKALEEPTTRDDNARLAAMMARFFKERIAA
jgi:GMP synthase (glutamine-hydrolysing)